MRIRTALVPSYFFFFKGSGDHRDLPSSPTRPPPDLLGPVAADIRPAHVVHEDDDDVGRSRRRAQRQLPVWFGFVARAPDLAGKARISLGFAGNEIGRAHV